MYVTFILHAYNNALNTEKKKILESKDTRLNSGYPWGVCVC